MSGATGTVRLAGLVAGSAALAVLIVWSIVQALPTPALMDFGSFWASGEAAGRGLDPYGIYPLTFHVRMPGFESWNPNLNPPFALPLFEVFAAFPPDQAFRVWWAISLAGYAATVALLFHAYRHELGGFQRLIGVLWAFALTGFWDTLVLGQIYVPLAFAALAGWLLLRSGRPLAAGLAIGFLVAVKPNFLVWPALLFLAGHPRAALSAGATFLVLSAAPVLAYGPEVFRAWVAVIGDDPQRAMFLTNVSLAGILQRLGLGGLSLPAAVTLLGALAAWAYRTRPTVLQASAVGLTGALIGSPIAWVHYALCMLPVFVAWHRNPLLRIAGLLLLVPVPLVLELTAASEPVRATIGSIYGWALILCLVATLNPKWPLRRPARLKPEAAVNATLG